MGGGGDDHPFPLGGRPSGNGVCKPDLASRRGGPAAALLGANTTEEALDILHGCGWLEKTMETLMEKITYHLEHRTGGKLQAEAVVFSNVYGILGKTKGADILLAELQQE